ncbi:ATPase inhibitor mai-2, mitochondrial-like isoform X1 [Spodoptera litura]|uniref:ATP synthase F1 subunit epsilon n=1 Tax=Spodoptera litura TaxID=69820 RepID=A0A9J7IN93_SPOLT|nr:ATPase inhibitor mai-2, mitochondrial-like isoform X1 [Spodoptera litura]
MSLIPRVTTNLSRAILSVRMYSGEPGSGAGKGGGGGGAIREAGGAFGKMEAAREDEYFYKKQKEQLANLKTHLDKEISFHEDQIKRHEDAIRRHKEKMADIDHKNA